MTLRSVARAIILLATLLFAQLIPLSEACAQLSVDVQGGDASEVAIAHDGTATHRGSGFVFQKQIAELPLRGLTVYGPSDASAYYTLRGGANGDAWVTFYVYPATISLADEDAGVEQAILERLAGHQIDPPARAVTTLSDGRVGWFEGTYQNIQAKTGYILVQRGGWFLKARFTIPDGGGSEAMDRALRALAALQWDWVPASGTAGGAKVAVR